MDVQKNDRTRWQVLALGRIDFSVEEPGPCSGIACVQSEQHPQQPQQDGNAHQRMGRARLSIYLPDLRTFPVRDGECAGDYMDRVWQSISEQQAQGIFTSYHTAVLCATCATTTLATLLAHGGKANLEEFLDSEVGRQAYGIATIAAVLAESTPDGVSQTVVLTAEPGADGRYCAEMVSTSRRTPVEQIVAAHAAANVRVYRVAYIAPNTHAQLESFYAVPQIATVLVPINYRLIADDFAYIINHSGARVVCVHADYLDAVEGIRAELPQVEHFVALEGAKDGWLQHEELLAAANGEFTRPRIAESDLLTINYTGGTTSRPKGVMITHRNAYMNTVGTLIHLHMTPGDRYLWTLSMFHANGWTFVWTVTAAGATHICLRRVEPARVFQAINNERVTMLCAAPTVLISIANGPEELRKQVRPGVRVITAGAPPAAATIQRVEGELGWEITQVYGLTETASFITVCEPRTEHTRLTPIELATVKARQGVELITSGELLVVDEMGNEVPHDGQTLGEIVARGNVVMQGYYNDPEATAVAMRDDGWFHTGDAAVVHPDGYAEVRDRIKDVIISGGENISSIEVEGILLRHPAVQEVVVVGLPDERWGEAPHAFAVRQPGASVTEDELRQFAREHMAHFKVPKSFRFVDEQPKTATGKIQKFVLRGSRPAIATQ